MMQWRIIRQWLGFLLVFCSFHFLEGAVTGTVYLSDGKIYQGAISLSRSLYFQDLIQRRPVAIRLEQVYMLELILQSQGMKQSSQEESSSSIERRFILGVHTWDGQSYWGQLHNKVFVTLANRKKYGFGLPKVQLLRNIPEVLNQGYFMYLIMDAGTKHKVPDLRKLTGAISPGGIFQQVYAVHENYGVVFAGRISADGQTYQFTRLIPGYYQLFWIGPKEIVFGMNPPPRHDLMDTLVDMEASTLGSWIRQHSDGGISMQMIYACGRYSKVQALVMQESTRLASPGLPTIQDVIQERKFWLWICSFRQNKWRVNHSVLLFQQKKSQPWPQLFHDDRIAQVWVPDTGTRTFDYSLP